MRSDMLETIQIQHYAFEGSVKDANKEIIGKIVGSLVSKMLDDNALDPAKSYAIVYTLSEIVPDEF